MDKQKVVIINMMEYYSATKKSTDIYYMNL